MSTQALTTKPAEKAMEFVPFGAADKIKLSIEIVKNIVAVPTRSGKTCTDRDAMKFMMLCQAQRLNPFAGDAFLVGYDSQSGANFSLITAHQAFLKRAETSPDYDGMLSGIIVQDDNDEIKEIEGDFHLPDQKVIGGWAKVFHKKRSHPTYRRIRMERFNSGFAQWKADAAGMICKCAEADALRSTFPTLLGGLYMQGEILDINTERVATDLPASRLVELAPSQPEKVTTTTVAVEPAPEKLTPQQELAAFVVGAECDFDHFMKWAVESGNIPATAILDSFDDVKEADAKRYLRNKTGLLAGLQTAKGGAK